MEGLTSKDILYGYLDRPINLVLEEKELAKLVKKRTGQTLEGKQLELLYNMLNSSHKDHNLRQMEANVNETSFQSVWNEEENAETTLNDNQITKLVKSLNHLDKSIVDEINYLQDQYATGLKDFDDQVSSMDNLTLIANPYDDLLEQVDNKLKELEKKFHDPK